MKRFVKHPFVKYALPALLMLVAGTLLGMKIEQSLSDERTLDQLEKLRNAFMIVNQRYVEEVNAEDAAGDAIEGMLDGLDPHSTYIPAKRAKEVRQNYQGSFGGIGIWYDVVRDTAQVINPIAGGPSEEVGLMPGDRIIAINDSTAVGLSREGVQTKLKGRKGTTVDVTVKRPGIRERYDFTIERGEIPIRSIPSSFMVDEKTGYIEITRFSKKTHDEFEKAMTKLEGQGMERLVLDLRSNPGGVMQSAVKIADELLSEGQTIVKTKGRKASADQSFASRPGGRFEEQPVTVLVNARSASASEIVSGALQDHDRALIVGRRTFGKGLVQKQFALPDESVLQMTVARYYTPVGRLIQTPYEGDDMKSYYQDKFSSFDEATFDPSEYTDSIADSLSYRTDHGREVFGGGGILPDVIVPPDTNSVAYQVRQRNLPGAFVNQWFASNEARLRGEWEGRHDAFVSDYTVDAKMMESFWAFADEQGLALTDEKDAADPDDAVFLRSRAEASAGEIKTRLKYILASRLYGTREAGRLQLRADETFETALTKWDRARELAAYHGGPAASTARGSLDGDGNDDQQP
ncbi:MAG: S41 family peptidase [Bacteroidetes bacterium QS_9_68_14]|nr:MAG: S41 family peptidase [Bacteroidetes bacterium QS_9_68_14]